MKHLLFLFAFLLATAAPAQKKYTTLWKQVEASQKKDLPATTIEKCNEIFRLAEADGDFAVQLRAFTTRAEARRNIHTDSLYTDLRALYRWKENEKDTAHRAVLTQACLDFLMGYWVNNLVDIRRRSNTEEEKPDTAQTAGTDPFAKETSLKKWSMQDFNRECLRLIHESTQYPEALMLHTADEYADIVRKGNGSRYFAHDLLHLIALHNIEKLSGMPSTGFPENKERDSIKLQILDMLQRCYAEKGNRSALVLVRLERMKQLRYAGNMPDETYEKELRTLIQEDKDLDVSAEACLQLVQYLTQKKRNTEALQLCDESMRKFLHYDRVKAFRQEREQILQGQVEIRLPQVVYPGEKLELHASHCNLKQVTLKLYPLKLDAIGLIGQNLYGKDFLKKHAAQPILRSFSLTPPADYARRDTILSFTAPQPGIYVVRTFSEKTQEETGYDLLYVSRLMLVEQQQPQGETELRVVDRHTGQPLTGVRIAAFGKATATKPDTLLTTDKRGCALHPTGGELFRYYAYTADDRYAPFRNIYSYYRKTVPGNAPTESVSLYTDRSIYRPGQTVYVKGIVHQTSGDSTWVRKDYSSTLTLHDANHKEIARAEMKTNEFGSFFHAFTLPARCLGGYFSVRSGTAQQGFRVEEYKRPSFEILLDTLRGTPRFNDTTCVSGRLMTLSGAPLQGDSVRFSVVRARIYPDYRWLNLPGDNLSHEETLAHGSVATDEKGCFRIPVYLAKPDWIREDYPYAFTYDIRMDATDAAGESHFETQKIRVGKTNLLLRFSESTNVCTDSLKSVQFTARNLNETKVATDIRARLIHPETYQAVWETTYPSNRNLPWDSWKNIPSGKYCLQMETTDAYGETVRDSSRLLLFSANDTQLPCDTIFWRSSIGEGNDDAKNIRILLGSSADSVYLFRDIYTAERRIESSMVFFSDSLLKFDLAYRPEYGDGATCIYSFVKEGKLYSYSQSIQKPQPDKSLKLKWTVFRDRLQAGQKEEWRLSVTRPDGTPAQAELMASLYDGALDLIYPHRFFARHLHDRRIFTHAPSSGHHSYIFLFTSQALKTYRYPDFTYDSWNFSFPYLFSIPYYAAASDRVVHSLSEVALVGRIAEVKVRSSGSSRAKHAAKAKNSSVASDELLETIAVTEEEEIEEKSESDSENILAGDISELGNTPDSYLRSDFRESAFFYPTLHTDSTGSISLSFTLPESLTKWHLIGLAHTADFHTGLLDEKITASKPLMLSSHLPRYLRQGDKAEVAARLYNISGKNLKGKVILELFNPANMYVFSRQNTNFHLAADSSATHTFAISCPENLQTVGIRLIADAGDFSDGEQRQLAVLPSRTHLIQSIPLTLRGEGSKEYDLSELFNASSRTATQKKYTVELYANPAWSAVMALPLLNTPKTDNACDLAVAYYANTLSAWLTEQSQELRLALQLWQSSGTQAQSRLTQNQELKNLLLEETPWAAEADEESGRIAAIGQLADRNTLDFQRNEMIRKLKDLQLEDGSFPWFHGMYPSRYITDQVVETLARLRSLTGTEPSADAQQILQKAYQYIYKEEGRSFDRLTPKDKKDYRLSSSDLRYLYLCTLAPVQPKGSAASAKAFYLEKLPGAIRDLDLFEKSRATTVLYRNGQQEAARAYYRSIREYSTQTEELGSFFAGRGTSGHLPECLLASLIEAARLMGDTALTEDMQFHLLRHKQTQMWQSPLANANAVYALLKDAKDLAGQGASCSLTIGSRTLSTQAQAGTPEAVMGYAKVSFPANEVKARKAVFSKTGKGPAWGAVYGECDEQTDRIAEQGTRVKIEKELFVLRRQTGKDTWEKLTPKTRLQKGDRILTRLTVENDRDLDFVSIKDSRAACLEPVNQLSGYRKGAYYSEKDASTTLFIDRLGRGTHTFEIESVASHSGTYHSGIASLQCAYSAEFTGHSASQNMQIR